LVLRPQMPQEELFAGLVAVLSGMLGALGYMQIVALARAGEPESRTVFYFALACVIGGAGWIAFAGTSTWAWRSATWLLLIGFLSSMGQWATARAYSKAGGHAGTLLVANLQYTGILFAALLGGLVMDDRIPLRGWIGIAVIILSGIGATVIRL